MFREVMISNINAFKEGFCGLLECFIKKTPLNGWFWPKEAKSIKIFKGFM